MSILCRPSPLLRFLQVNVPWTALGPTAMPTVHSEAREVNVTDWLSISIVHVSTKLGSVVRVPCDASPVMPSDAPAGSVQVALICESTAAPEPVATVRG